MHHNLPFYRATLC